MLPHESSPLIIDEIVNGKKYRRSPRKYSIVSSFETGNDQSHESPNRLLLAARRGANRCGDVLSASAGMSCLAMSILSWVTMSEAIQSAEESHYDRPFLIKWAVNSSYILMVVPWLLLRAFHKYSGRGRSGSLLRSIPLSLSWTKSISATTFSSVWTRSLSGSRTAQKSPVHHHRTDQAIVWGVAEELNGCELVHSHCGEVDHRSPSAFRAVAVLAAMNAINLAVGYSWYLSLPLTVGSLNNTIHQTSCVFVLFFSCFVLGHKMTARKVFACIIAVGGVCSITMSVPSEAECGSNSVAGIVLNVLSTALWAAWEVAFAFIARKHLRGDRLLSDTLMFQCGVGAVNLLLFWPLVVLLHYTEIEPLELQLSRAQIMGVLAPCLMDNLFTAGVLCGIAFCGAMFMAMGMILVVPITFFADIVVLRKQSVDIVNVYSAVGALGIISGFVLIQKGHWAKTKQQDPQKL